MTDDTRERVWERGWQDHHDRQLRRLARLPLTEKLRWLEETERVVRQIASSRRFGREHNR